MLEQPSKRDLMRGLLKGLEERDLTEFGSVIDREVVHELLEIEMPRYASKEVFDGIAMAELAAIDYCRNALLGQGKYLAGTRTGYRVLLPSENKGQIDSYMSSADRKLSRALKLSKNSPRAADMQPDQTETRIHMKRTSARSEIGAYA